MTQDARRARRAGRVVLAIYREYDGAVAAAAVQRGVTCREGCAHCCRLPATATVPEMVPVIEDLVGRNDWATRRREIAREIDAQLRELTTIDVLDEGERATFFQRQLPCMFLRDQRCSIYALRPATCRYHLSVSPPANCALGAADPVVARLDLRELENQVAIRGAEELGELAGGPIPLALVLAADLLGVELDVDREVVDRVTRVCISVREIPSSPGDG